MSRSIIVIDWRGWTPPPYDKAKHDPCDRCGYRITWWSQSHDASVGCRR